MRLLPKDHEAGWTAYAWLIYLFFVPLMLLFSHVTSLRVWAANIAGMIALMVFYFWGYWLHGQKVLWIILAITLLGVGFAGPGGSGAHGESGGA